MVNESGASDAPSIRLVVLSEYSEQLSPISSNTQSESFKVVSSKDLGDPEMWKVIQWHLDLCHVCDPTIKTARFGIRPTNFCSEYFEIIQEYREYEGHYAMKGNP